MKSMGKNPKAKQLQEMMSDVDIFGDDGIITFDDFLYIMVQNTSQESASGELLEVFRVFDRDGDSLIYALELGEGMKDMGMKITAEEAERMVREADLDGDGFLSFMSFPK
ncbi:PREDICTED: calmodulin-like protein 9 isoform X2 [Brassica oleracea var. oleracea]|uniref:EF-hand domain-containing protein n=2 Tax=Brassica oleracea var. oleracea TaxID=109376 RepID=A0A0D3DSA8_BRAOL|nr:PREDICTED: calmodulin-like protein 9 isoform X2 [Brassica oleracea var. oleracea]